ncbi:MAG: RNA-binding S4 domain-containing protein [Pirellulales bacterium]|nr:RNA-binding S4 domain-containing protein [Pirellulales bacterium]
MSHNPDEIPLDPDELAQLPALTHVICLDQFLRVCRLVGTGGQAKLLIQAGEVKLNGQVETRRRKKLYPQDIVEFAGKSYAVADHVRAPLSDKMRQHAQETPGQALLDSSSPNTGR